MEGARYACAPKPKRSRASLASALHTRPIACLRICCSFRPGGGTEACGAVHESMGFPTHCAPIDSTRAEQIVAAHADRFFHPRETGREGPSPVATRRQG